MIPVGFKNQTEVILGEDYNLDIPIYREGERRVSCWKLNKEELEEINKSGVIWLHIVGDMPLMRLDASDPFKKLRPVICHEKIANRVRLMLVEDEEIIVLTTEEGEHNFRVHKDYDGEWSHIVFRRRGEINGGWNMGFYSFKEEIEVIGPGEDCPEYWWLIHQYGLMRNQTLILKRQNNDIL